MKIYLVRHGQSVGKKGTQGYFHGGWFAAVEDSYRLLHDGVQESRSRCRGGTFGKRAGRRTYNFDYGYVNSRGVCCLLPYAG